MPRTTTSFSPGHRSSGGRPKGAGTEDWRRHARMASLAGERADLLLRQLSPPAKLQTMVTPELIRLLKMLRNAEAVHANRARYRRPVKFTNRFRVAFGWKPTLTSAPNTNEARPVYELTPQPLSFGRARRKKERPSTDAVARRSFKKAMVLDGIAQAVEAELGRHIRPRAVKQRGTQELLRQIEIQFWIEKHHLKHSFDPRPVVRERFSFVLLFCADGYDPMHRPGTELVLRTRNPESPWTDEQAQQAFRDGLYERHQTTAPQELDGEDADNAVNTDDGLGSGEERLELMTEDSVRTGRAPRSY